MGSDLVQSFFAGERIAYLVVAALVGVIATIGSLSLTASRTTEEPAPAEPTAV